MSRPLRGEGFGRGGELWYGQLSGFAGLLAGVLGAWLVTALSAILPYALVFAAGAMIFIAAEELIPEAQREENVHLATSKLTLGFVVMMVLDVAFG